MPTRINRRGFLQTSTALGIATSTGALLKPSRVLGANERLNIGVIGVGGRGASDLAGVAGENIIALCDVDEGSGLSSQLVLGPAAVTACLRSRR